MFDWPKDGKLVLPHINNEVETVYLLADATPKELSIFTTQAGVVALDLTIKLPKKAPDPISSTVVLRLKGTTLDINQPPAAEAAPEPKKPAKKKAAKPAA